MWKQEPSVYLAGPEVFLADARALAEAKKRMCSQFGFAGVFPMDTEIDKSGALNAIETARQISRLNEELIRRCDLLIANCTPFRGVSMDVGTAFEIGFARALGQPVFGYSNVTEDYKVRAHTYGVLTQLPWDAVGQAAAIEDFGLAENLMIAVPILEMEGDLIRTKVDPGKELTDLTGFKRCLELARASFSDKPRRSLPRRASR